MLVDDTIAAISSPPGEGAVAVLRISGPQAAEIAGRLFQGRAKTLVPRVLHFGTFRDETGKLDEGLLAVFPGPRSYTGEDWRRFIVMAACWWRRACWRRS